MAEGMMAMFRNTLFPTRNKKALNSVDPMRGGWVRIYESFAGAWQNNVEVNYNTVLSNPHDFACRTLLASDIAKLRIKLVQRSDGGVWSEVPNFGAAYGVLLKPNHYQSRIQFIETWMMSKLQRGNALILKERDRLDRVVALYVLDWTYVRPLIADNGDVFYELNTDKLSHLPDKVIVPAREVIHDRFNCMFHPLVGVSPIFAAGLSAMQGVTIQDQATKFFQNASRPGGVLTAPGAISDETAGRLKSDWQANFTGDNRGKVAVLGDGLEYSAFSTTPVDAQLIEQLKWSAEVICSVYHVPPYKVGLGAMPSYNNIQALNVEYYSQGLQRHIEDIELLLDEALGLKGEGGAGKNLGTEFDLDGLLRMDSSAQFETLEKAKSVMTLDERRRRVELPPLTTGGDTVYLQQQDHSVEAIAARDKQLIEQAKNPPEPPQADPAANDNAMQQEANAAMIEILKGLQ